MCRIGVVEFAGELERPELRAKRQHGVGRRRRRIGWPAQRHGGDPSRAVEFDAERAVIDAVRREAARQRGERDALPRRAALRFRRKFSRARRDRLIEFRARHHFIDQPPLDRAFALHAFLGGAEEIGMIATHFAFVGDAGETAGAGQYREQRQFRQCDRRRAVVHQHDVVGRERELVAAACRCTVDGADGGKPGILA